MPKYTFVCPKCGSSVDRYVPRLVKDVECECGHAAIRQMPKLNGPATVKETVDSYTGATWVQDQTELRQDRKEEYYWSVEVPRFVNSGTYSIETMLENGWIWVDDHNHVQVHKKPPSKR